MKLSASLLITVLAAFWIVPQMRAASPATLSKVVVALKPDKDPDAMIAEREQLSKYLSDKLGRPVEVIVPLSAAVILEGLSNGTIDLAYLSATDMLNAISQQSATILLAGEIDGKPSYQSYWVTLKDKPYQSIADLKGKPVAFSSKTSTSGYVIPLWDLRQKSLISDRGRQRNSSVRAMCGSVPGMCRRWSACSTVMPKLLLSAIMFSIRTNT